jgi:hypothetical protein
MQNPAILAFAQALPNSVEQSSELFLPHSMSTTVGGFGVGATLGPSVGATVGAALASQPETE